MREKILSQPTTTPATSLTLGADRRAPWAIALPLALVLSSCAPTTPLQTEPPREPATPQESANAAFYRSLNAELQNDARTRGHILVIDPLRYASMRSLRDNTERDLRALITTATAANGGSGEPPAIMRIIQPLEKLARQEAALLKAPPNKDLPNQDSAFGARRLLLSQLASRSYNTGGATDSAGYVCLAIGAPTDAPYSVFLDSAMGLGLPPWRTDYTPAFKQALNYANSEGYGTARHETGHCIRGNDPREGETPLAMMRRLESAADAFEVLGRIRDGEANMPTKIAIGIQWRRANLGLARPTDFAHDTSATLGLLLDDARRKPNLRQELLTLSVTQLEDKAHGYALRGQLRDYPHLADASLNAGKKFLLSQYADAEIRTTAAYVSGRLFPGQNAVPPLDNLSAENALRMVQIADAASRHLVLPAGAGSDAALAPLRQKHPAIMQAAEAALTADADHAPYINPPFVPSQPNSTKQPTGLGKREAPRP